MNVLKEWYLVIMRKQALQHVSYEIRRQNQLIALWKANSHRS